METNLVSEQSEHAVDEEEVVGVHVRKQGWHRGNLRMGLKGGGSEEGLERCRRDSSIISDPDSIWLSEQDIRRPQGWKNWEEREEQRPAPQDPPRNPDMEYCDQTACAIGEEGGALVFSPLKDKYRRTSQQLQDLASARQDQRKLGGGVYRCLDEGYEGFELTIQKGYKSKVVGVSLKKLVDGKRQTIFQSFAIMDYEYFLFGEGGRRLRQVQPEETLTGWVWYGYGGDSLPLPSSNIQVYCERVDKDLHFSGAKCSRNTEEVAASQMLCDNADCGIITWHLSRKCFRKGKGDQYEEKWQEDIALVRLKTGKEVLIWTHDHRKIKRSRWVRLESSPQFDAYVVDHPTRERVESVVARKCLPQHTFPNPAYVPDNQQWKVMEPLLLQRRESRW